MRRVGGWWRLWSVLAVIYGCLIAAYTWTTWPEASRTSHDPRFLKQMSPEALAVINRPKSLTEIEQAFVAADDAGAIETARKLAQDIRRLRERPEWERAPIVLEMPNGYEFQVAGDTKPEQSSLVGRDYVSVLQSVSAEKRIAALGAAVLLWLLPSVAVCVLGLAVAWILRGFKAVP